MKYYEYQAYICNKILYSALRDLEASGVSAEDKRVMLNCMGKTLIRMSIGDKPIDYYMKNEEASFFNGEYKLSEDDLREFIQSLKNDLSE